MNCSSQKEEFWRILFSIYSLHTLVWPVSRCLMMLTYHQFFWKDDGGWFNSKTGLCGELLNALKCMHGLHRMCMYCIIRHMCAILWLFGKEVGVFVTADSDKHHHMSVLTLRVSCKSADELLQLSTHYYTCKPSVAQALLHLEDFKVWKLWLLN